MTYKKKGENLSTLSFKLPKHVGNWRRSLKGRTTNGHKATATDFLAMSSFRTHYGVAQMLLQYLQVVKSQMRSSQLQQSES